MTTDFHDLQKIVILPALVVFASCLSCAKKNPIVVVDDWWNLDFAKSDCALRATRNKAACLFDPTLEVRNFEAQLVTYFAADPSCSGIVLVGPNGREGLEPHWLLMLDFLPGESTQSWEIVAPGVASTRRQVYSAGKGEPKEIVHTVCAVVQHGGGSVVN